MKQKRQVVMLPTTEASHLFYVKDIEEIHCNLHSESKSDKLTTAQHLYILSSEEIKEGDWVYHSYYPSIAKSFDERFLKKRIGKIITLNDINSGENIIYFPDTGKDESFYVFEGKKVIATTDKSLTINYEGYEYGTGNKVNAKVYLPQIPQSLIKAYANKPFDYVMLEYWKESEAYCNSSSSKEILKLTDNNEVVWSEVEEVEITDEEIEARIKIGLRDRIIAESKEKMYSREEVELEKARYANDMNRDIQAKILSWYAEHDRDPEFAKHFGITSVRKGKID